MQSETTFSLHRIFKLQQRPVSASVWLRRGTASIEGQGKCGNPNQRVFRSRNLVMARRKARDMNEGIPKRWMASEILRWCWNQPALIPSFSQGSKAPSSSVPSACGKSLQRRIGAPTHRLPRSSILSHNEPSSTRVEKKRVAEDPSRWSNRGKAVRSGSAYSLSTRSNCVEPIRWHASP